MGKGVREKDGGAYPTNQTIVIFIDKLSLMANCVSSDILNKKLSKSNEDELRYNGLVHDYNDLDIGSVLKYIQNSNIVAEDTAMNDSGTNSEDIDKGPYEDFVNIVANSSNSDNIGNIEAPSNSGNTDDNSKEDLDTEVPSTDDKDGTLEVDGEYGVE